MGFAVPRALRSGLAVLAMVVGVIFVPHSAQADDSQGTTALVEPPIQVDTSILLTELSGLSVAPGTFNASFYVSMRCADPCERSEWDILNAATYSRQVISEEPDETWWLVSGTFTFSPELGLFPFDTQDLSIKIEHRLLSAEALVFVPDVAKTEVAPEVQVSGWDREPFDVSATSTGYASVRADYSRLTFTVPLSRSIFASITKYYLPLLIFILVSIATLALSRFEVQIATAAAGLVGMTVFYLATGTGMGPAGYLTLWDLSVLVGYLILGLILLCGVIGVRRKDAGAFEGPTGLERMHRLRRVFLALTLSLLVVGSITLLAVDALT